MPYFILFFLMLFPSLHAEEKEENLSNLLGQAWWQAHKGEDSDSIAHFLKGIEACEKDNLSPIPYLEFNSLLSQAYTLRRQCIAKHRLEETKRFFETLASRKELICLEPKKLYYKQAKKGALDEICNVHAMVRINCRIETIDQKVLTDLSMDTLSNPACLNDFITGLAHGMIGMKVGEVREIYIHPELAYGSECNMDPNLSLIAKVELIEISSQEKTKNIPEMTKLKLNEIEQSEEELLAKLKSVENTIAFQIGVNTWDHYKQFKDQYPLKDILSAFDKARQGELIVLTTKERQSQLSRLHWELYHRRLSRKKTTLKLNK